MAHWTPRLLQIGEFRLDAGCMFGLIPRVVWTKWFPAGVIDDANRMPLQQNSLLLEHGGKLVVVEVGIGDKTAPKERDIYAQRDMGIHAELAKIGCDVRDVSTVIVTHLHFDHAGGLTRMGDGGKPVLTFPNAEVVTQRGEWNDALANKSTMHKTYLREHLGPNVAERVRLIDGEAEVLPGIRVLPMPGHTWGQQAVLINTPTGRTICFTPDVMPTALHARPTCNMSYDVEPYTSMLQRIALLERAEREKWTLVLDHEPGYPVFTVEHDADKGGHRLVKAELPR